MRKSTKSVHLLFSLPCSYFIINDEGREKRGDGSERFPLELRPAWERNGQNSGAASLKHGVQKFVFCIMGERDM